MKVLLGVLIITLVAVTLNACDLLSAFLPGGPTECEHTGGKATCTAAAVCELCGESYGEALGHKEEVLAGKDATCTESGLTEGKKCSVCEAILVEQEKIDPLGHKDGDGDFVCDACKAGLCTEHTPAEAVRENETAPTCEKEGSYESVVKCSNCGEELSREAKSIEKLPHTEEVLEGKAATCTETGLTEGKKCSVCGETLVAQEEIKALGHTEETVPGKAATCTETGLTEGKKCSVCGETLVAQEEIPAGHKMVDGVCTECGLISNLLVGKSLIPAGDAASNIYSASYGYGKINDGDLASRYSSKKNGGKVEAVIDLGAVYDLYEFKVLLYDYNQSAFSQFGTGMEIQVLFGGEWTTVVNATADNFNVVVTGDQNWLTFDLGGANARQVKFIIPEHGSTGWSTFWEIECSAKASSAVEPEPEVPVLVENVFAGKQFTPTEDALASVLNAGWWKGGGYETLTDGIKNADNSPGRFSTAMALTGMMDSTIDLGGSYELHSFKMYTYDPAAGTGAGSVGATLLIQVYSNGEWIDVVTCSDNASIMSHLVVNEGTYNDYLEFDLDGVVAEKVRFYISASASGSGTTYEEIECSGYKK